MKRRIRRPKTIPVRQLTKEIIDGLKDFADALEKGEVIKRLTCRQLKLQPARQSVSRGKAYTKRSSK